MLGNIKDMDEQIEACRILRRRYSTLAKKILKKTERIAGSMLT